jgi:hypothetical protein
MGSSIYAHQEKKPYKGGQLKWTFRERGKGLYDRKMKVIVMKISDGRYSII